MRRVALAAAVSIALAGGLATAARAQDEESELETQRQRLESLQQEIRQKRDEAARLGRRESSVIQELRRVENELGVTQELVTTLEEQIAERSR